MQWILIPFGWIFLIAMAISIIVPYLQGKGELLSPWTLFLLGSANFVGFAAVQSGNAEPFQQYSHYENITYVKLVIGAVVYFAFTFAAYYWVKFPRRLAGHTFRKWVTDESTAVLCLLLGFCALLTLGTVFFPNVQFFGQITIIMGQAAGPIALTLALMALIRQPYNPVLTIIFVVTFVLTFGAAMAVGSGRRSLLGTAMVFPIVAYWLWARYRSASKNVMVASIAAIAIYFVITGYTAIRHRERAPDESNLTWGINSLRMLPKAMLGLERTDVLGGDAVEASLVAINHYGTHDPHEPFFSLWFIIANPIPRAYWENKPEGLGNRIAYDSGYADTHHGIFNWGPGIVGHGYHEGGLYILLIYGLMTGVCFRYAEELIKRQPDNPILLGVFAAASGQIVGLVRGEFGLFVVMIIGAILTGIVVNFVGRMFFGTGRIYPTPEEDQYTQWGQGQVFYPADPEGLFPPGHKQWRGL